MEIFYVFDGACPDCVDDAARVKQFFWDNYQDKGFEYYHTNTEDYPNALDTFDIEELPAMVLRNDREVLDQWEGFSLSTGMIKEILMEQGIKPNEDLGNYYVDVYPLPPWIPWLILSLFGATVYLLFKR